MVTFQISHLEYFHISILHKAELTQSHSAILVQAVVTIAGKRMNQRTEQRTFSVAHVSPRLVLGKKLGNSGEVLEAQR